MVTIFPSIVRRFHLMNCTLISLWQCSYHFYAKRCTLICSVLFSNYFITEKIPIMWCGDLRPHKSSPGQMSSKHAWGISIYKGDLSAIWHIGHVLSMVNYLRYLYVNNLTYVYVLHLVSTYIQPFTSSTHFKNDWWYETLFTKVTEKLIKYSTKTV